MLLNRTNFVIGKAVETLIVTNRFWIYFAPP